MMKCYRVSNGRTTQTIGAFLFGFTVLTFSLLPVFAQPEIRGVWSSRFQWPSENPATAQSNLTNLFNNMVTGHFNTAFVQIRGQCDGFYPSPYEPWSPIISSPDGTNPGWDPLLYACTEAHSRNLKIHAYFNTHTIWGSSTAPNAANYPNHIFYQHGNPADPAKRDWLLYNNVGNPAPYSEYYWMNPGIPAADAHVRREAVYIVSNYDVDGLHYDRARMTEIGYGRNPIAVARWDDPNTAAPNDGQGNPHQLDWDSFMRDSVTRQLINICGQCWGIKPWVVMSSGPLGLWDNPAYPSYPSSFHYGYRRAQDAKAWMQMGAQDFIVPQIYWDNGNNKPDFNEVMDDWLLAANAAGRYLVPASNMSNGQAEVEAHALYARAQGAMGHNIWHSGITQWANWSTAGHPYESATPATPSFPWRSTEGVITGHVNFQDPCSISPAVDAHIDSTFTTWTALSSGDGFFSFLRVPPGTYTLTTTHPGMQAQTTANVVVVAGQATNVVITGQRTPPAAPTGLTASTGTSAIILGWNDNSPDESGFEIWRGTVAGGPYTLVTTATANMTSYNDTPGAAGIYYYVVRAVNGCVTSAYTNEASASIAAPVLSTTVVPGQTTVTLQWTDIYSDEIRFEVLRSTAAGGPYTQLASPAADTTTYIDDAVLYVTDTSWNGSFFYAVRAVSNAGTGPQSNESEAVLSNVPDLIMESRTWTGGVPLGYTDVTAVGGSWANTAAKSLVTNPSVRGSGARFSGTGSLGSYAVFTPSIFVHGNYEILATGPNPTIGLNVNSPGTEVVVRDGTTTPPLVTGTFNNSRFNTLLADNWMQFDPPLIAEFPAGSDRNIRLTNTHVGTLSSGHRFNIDAIRLRLISRIAPVIGNAGATLTAESCIPGNGVLDPAETVTVSFCLENTGNEDTSNLVATLNATGGVTAPSGPQNYGVIEVGEGAACRSFTFTVDASASCGDTITATLSLSDGIQNLGDVTFQFTLGSAGQCCSDVQPCTITCPENITVSADAGNCGAIVNFAAPQTSGACSALTYSHQTGSVFPVGTTLVTVSSGGGPSCSFNVTVNGTTTPQLNGTADFCLGDRFFLNTSTGDYVAYCNDRVLSGTGILTKRNCRMRFKANAADHSIRGSANLCKGTVKCVLFTRPGKCILKDPDYSDNICTCSP